MGAGRATALIVGGAVATLAGATAFVAWLGYESMRREDEEAHRLTLVNLNRPVGRVIP